MVGILGDTRHKCGKACRPVSKVVGCNAGLERPQIVVAGFCDRAPAYE